jgi:hypothetical protein
LAGYAVVFCVNLPAPDAAAAERLRDYAWGGGHLFWIAGPNVQPEAYNRMSDQFNGQLLPLPLAELRQPAGKEDSRHIGSLDKAHPALAPLAEPASLYQSVLVHRHFTFKEDAQAQARVLARLDDGQPVLLERAAGSGSVLLLGTGVQGEWTNLPLKPLFLPLFARLTFHLAGAEVDRSQVTAGAPLVIPLGGQSGTPEVEIVRPSGDVLRVRSPEPNAQTFRYADTHDPGVYLLRLTGTASLRQFAFAVNMDPEECDPAVVTAEELKGRFGKHPFVVCENPDDLAGTIHRLREGKSLWEVFLAAVLAGLVLEAFLANRVGARPAGQAPGARPAAAIAPEAR